MAAALCPLARSQTVLLGTYDGSLPSGTIAGNVSIANGTAATFINNATFTGTTATFGSSATLNWNQIGTLTGKTLSFGSGSDLLVGTAGSLTLDVTSSASGDVQIDSTGTGASITSAATISHTTGTGFLYAPTFINQGAVTANAGTSLYVGYYNGYATTNAVGGTITADGTNTNVYLHSVVNQGTLTAQNGGALVFQGTNASSDLGTVVIGTGGGHAYLNGTLTNATLNAPTGGSFELYGGTINFGTIGAGALTFTSSGGTLNNLSYTGDFNLPNSTSVTLTGGTGFTGTNLGLGTSATLTWNQIGTLTGNAITQGAGSSITVGTSGALTLGSGTTVTGTVNINSTSTGGSIVNQGTITQSSGTGFLYAPTFTNQGAVTASAGTSLYVGYYNGYATTNAAGGTITADGTNTNVYLHSIVNQGTLTAQNGGALLFQGTNASSDLGNVVIGTGGGHAYLNGTLNNTTLGAPTGGSYELYGGTINNGTIGAGALTFTSSGGTLNNLSYTGDLNLPNSTSVTLTGGTGFTGTNLGLGTSATLTWNQIGTLTGDAITQGAGSSIAVGASDTLTLGSGTTVTGTVNVNSTATGGSIVNQGTVTQSSGTGYLYAPTFTNQGAISASAGTSLYVGYYNGYATTNAAGGTITADGANTYAYLHSIVNQGTLTAQNGGALLFQGTNASSDLGNVVIGTGGGHAYLNGTLANTTLNAPTGGSYELYGGTINNGTIGAGALTFTSSGGTLNNLSYTGDFNLPNSTSVTLTGGTGFTGTNLGLGTSATLYWSQIGTLTGDAITQGIGSSIAVGASDTLTLGSGTTVAGTVDVNSTATGGSIVNQGTITQSSGTGFLYAPTLTNQGAITGSAGTSLYVGYYNGYAITNAAGGTITADGANTNVYLHGIVNQGTLTAQNGGALIFQGTNASSDLGNVVIGTGGGHAYLNGTLNNTTLNAPTGGSYELYGGTINSGTIAAGALTFTGFGGTLNNLSYTGNLALPSSTSVTFTGGTTFTGTSASLGSSSTLTWNQTAAMAGKNLTFGTGGAIVISTANTLTLDSATNATGDLTIYAPTTGAAIINQGTLAHTASIGNGTGTIYAPTFTNQGAISAGTGSTLYLGTSGYTTTNAPGATVTANGANANLYLEGTLVNQGTLTAQSGGALIFEGSIPTGNLGAVTIGAGGGHAYLSGTLDNTAATLAAPTGGSYELYHGTINNGTIGAGALSFTSSGGTLSNVSYTGNLTLPASSYSIFTNGTTFTGSGATLGNSSGLYWDQGGTLAGKALSFGTNAYVYLGTATSSLTLDSATTATGDVTIYSQLTGASITNQGTLNQTTGTGSLYAPTFTNQGTVNVAAGAYLYLGNATAGFTFANPAGAAINVTGGTASLQSALVNAGVINVASGTLIAGTNLTNGPTGTISGMGTISGDLTVTGGTLSPGLSPSLGTLTLASGSLIVSNPATLAISLGGATADELLIVSPPGAINIGSGLLTLNLNLLGVPTASTYNLISITGGSGFSGYLAGLPLSGNTITASYLGNPYTFSVQYQGTGIYLTFTPVPEPGTWALLGTGLLVVAGAGWRGRRRRRTA